MNTPLSDATLDRVLDRLCDVSAAIGGTVLVAIACVTVVSVVGRAFFSHPILGDIELVQLGCAVVVASFLPYTQHRRANIMVDFFTAHASMRTQRLMDTFGTLLYTIVMALILWRVAVGGIDIKAAGERSMLMDIPLWLPYTLMLPGLALCVAIGARQTLVQIRTALHTEAHHEGEAA
ncbi:TRAP transporter small permease [Uliginosibacterium sp. H3]|uniref:TRAP transporter small permease protein n=1 Tax=Uliginosibacterium silvisoli TaxID=3114758 RepID=A0ABU6K2V0_9RHOO|nr:TRAP transporter small permease [Uliginosibacterium sp. H3]